MISKSLFFTIGCFLLLSVVGCTDDPPSIRVYNERPTKANVQVKAQSGNTININDVASTATTNYQDVAVGAHLVTAVIQNESVSPSVAFEASENTNYTIVVVNSTPPSLRVDSSGK
jgi:hypothetical protein